MLYGSNDVLRRKDGFWWLGQWLASFEEIYQQTLLEVDVKRQFQAETPKYKSRNISKTISNHVEI